MYARFCVNRETAADYMRLFVNRLAYGIQRWTPLPDGTAPYRLAQDRDKNPKALDESVIRMHLNGDITINLFAISPTTQRSKWIAIDADFEGALPALFKIQRELESDGVDAALEQSRRGGHLWVFGESPLLAAECRIYIYNLALRMGIPIVGGGIKTGIEVFPKQDSLSNGQFGNAIRGPLGVHRKTGRRYWFYDADLTPEAQLAYLRNLRKFPEQELKLLIEGMTLPEAYRPKPVASYIPPAPGTERREFRILDFVRPSRKEGSEWVTRCPACAEIGKDRSRDNLKISIRDPRLYRCWAGCTKEQIRAALGQPIRRNQMA